MGRRKRMPDLNNTPPSEAKTYSSEIDCLWKEKSSCSIERHANKSLASIIDIMDNSTKRSSSSRSRWNQNRSIYSPKPRNFNGCHYSRRKSSNNVGASSSHAKSDEKVWLRKGSNQSQIDHRRHRENKERAFCGQEIIRASFSVADALELACGLCQGLLRTKTCIFENTISSGELSVVAVLVCGHVFHAECLERRTCDEAMRDPLCPLCEGRENTV